MKHSIAVKFLVILLTALSLVAAFAGGVGIVAIEGAGLYVNSLDELQGHEYESLAKTLSSESTALFIARHFGDMPFLLRESLYSDPEERSDVDHWLVEIYQENNLVSTAGSAAVAENAEFTKKFPIKGQHYAMASDLSPSQMEQLRTALTQPEADNENPQQPLSPAEKLLPEGYDDTKSETLWRNGSLTTYYLYYYPAPELTATVYLQEEVLESSSLHILTTIYPYRYSCIAVLALGLILFAAGMVFSLWTAGTAPNGEIRPGGINRIPIDVYALIVAAGTFLLIQLFLRLSQWTHNEGPHPGNLSLMTVNLMAITLLGIGFLYALAAQIKVKGAYIWHHSATGWFLTMLWKGIRFLWRSCGTLVRMLPVIWQWLLTAAIMGIAICTACLLSMWYSAAAPVLIAVLMICLLVTLYGGYAFGTLITGAKRMSEGNLNHKIPTKYLIGSFKDFALELNTVSDTAKLAAEHEMRSERMKSELITNVSHDIKTPLTSIINYVDLLQKPHTPSQQQEYLEVLSRQSDRMKKLIVDLIELSKANTGNITVDIISLDAAETVNQALGEFADKLEAARLVSVFRQPQQPVMMKADGRLTWRVLSNLLSNAVKYAMPDTRLYIDLVRLEDTVLLSLKNVSKEELTIHAEELMERFVRGDTSRKSEGSGLGLNIAKSLMEVQGGQMELLLDGDLFKVTLIFPAD